MTLEERAKAGPVLFDGAMGTMIHRKNPSDEDYAGLAGCSEILNATRPDLIRAIHDEYLAAGSDVIGTNSFGANEIVLAEYGIADRARELARRSAQIAREAADSAASPEKPRFVAGSVGPGTKLVSLGHTDWETMYRSYREHAAGLLEGGVDAFLIETCQDLLQIKCAIVAIRDVCGEAGKDLPILVTMTVETTGTLLVGSEVGAVIAALKPFGLFALGINCATGPSDMAPYVREIAELWGGLMLVQPNAGLPRNVNGEFVYDLAVEDYVRSMRTFMENDGVTMVGGCCGTTPEFIGALAKALPDLRARQSPERAFTGERTPDPAGEAVSSLFTAQTLTQVPPPFFIGERTNTNGSKLFRETLLKDDWDGLVDIARQQAETGVHALDLCVAYTGRNEKADMGAALSRIATAITLPIVIDTTDESVLEAALKRYGGRAIVNSVNMEDGEDRARRICSLAARFGAALIALVIDETGMAREVEHKLAVARRLHSIALECGLRSGDLIFDMLTFTLGSGDETLRDSALATMEGIRRIKAELPGVRTVLGLSNVSFGLSPASRKALNSVFLDQCVRAGLDSAIVNLAQIVPLSSLPEEDTAVALRLIGNDTSAGDPLFAFLNHFAAKAGEGGQNDAAGAEADAPQSASERLQRRVIRGSKADLEDLLEEELANRPALAIINEVLIPAMKTVGELFGSGKMQLPFVLQSAEVMKAAVALLEPRLERSADRAQTSIVLATVRGDVHDIGKNLVEIILSNNGYKVYNLGIKVEIAEMIRKAEEVRADAIGMSGLLVKSTAVMKENIEELARRGMKIPVLLGGAALTPSFVHEDCAAAHIAGVAYCADAFAGLHAMNTIRDGSFDEWLAAEREKLASWKRRATPTADATESAVTGDSPGPISPYIPPKELTVPEPPFLGVRHTADIDLDEVFGYLTEEVLFRGRWGYRRGKLSKEEYARLIEDEVRPELESLKKKARDGGLLRPAVSWGYFRCNSQGDSLVIWDPAGKPGTELARLSFPRQKDGERRCISDWFRAEADGPDLIALQICTVGPRASAESAKLYAENRYRDYLLFHGLSVETAEALAEYWHRKIRLELGIAGEDGAGILDFVEQRYRGGRYSFGYPACPDLAQNRILCDILDSGAIGVTVGEGDQMFPEQTTSAFIAHHPQAKYFGA